VAIIGLGWLQTKTVVHILRVPFRFLAPGILILAVIGTYALRNLMVDVWVMFAAGIVGFFLKRTGYSAAGVVLGLILGGIGEASFAKSMQLMQYDLLGFFQRPISAVLLLLGLGAVVTSVIGELRGAPAPKALID
jgi:putative tricarboxylic transport membrane protein